MKTLGQILKDARVSKSYSLMHLEGVTKIKSGFIDSIEKEKWEALPPFPTVLGFVKSLANPLDIDPKMAVAVLKRDYPPKKIKISPKPDVESRFVWSPKLTFIIGVSAVLLALSGYLIFQYIHFISPPRLIIDSPKENQVITGKSITVFGSTDSDTKIVVNDQPVIVLVDGKFSIDLNVVKETKEVIITASSRSGKVTTVRRAIEVRLNN
jgi:cytoskeletal protein RodZ